MKLYGIRKLATKKGRQRFRDTQLTTEEQMIWDSPDRPDNIGTLIAGATVETMKQAKTIRTRFKAARK